MISEKRVGKILCNSNLIGFKNLALYEQAGVREYWVVFPVEYVLQQFVLNEAGKYELKNSFTEDEVFTAHIFPDMEVDLGQIFVE